MLWSEMNKVSCSFSYLNRTMDLDLIVVAQIFTHYQSIFL